MAAARGSDAAIVNGSRGGSFQQLAVFVHLFGDEVLSARMMSGVQQLMRPMPQGFTEEFFVQRLDLGIIMRVAQLVGSVLGVHAGDTSLSDPVLRRYGGTGLAAAGNAAAMTSRK